MAIKKENVIYEISAEADKFKQGTDEAARSVKSLDTQAKETSKGSQRAFDEMGKSAKAYTEKLTAAEREQKRLARTIQEQQNITKEFQSELLRIEQRLRGVGKNTVEFQKLTKEATRLKDAIKDNNLALNQLRVNKKNVDDSVKDLNRLANAAKKANTEAKAAGGGVRDFGDALGQLNPQVGGVTSQLDGFLGTLGRLGPLGGAAVAGIAAIAGGFLLAKQRVEEFDDEVEVAFNNISVTVNRGLDSIAEGFAGLFNLDPAQNLDTFGKRVTNLFDKLNKADTQLTFALLGEDAAIILEGIFGGPDAAKRAKDLIADEKEIQKIREQITRTQQKFDDIVINNLVRRAQLEEEITNARLEFEESRTEGIKNEGAFNKLVAAQGALYKLNRAELSQQLQLAKDLNNLTRSRFDTEIAAEKQLEAQIIRLDAEFNRTEQRNEKLRRFLNSGTEAQNGIIKDLQEKIKALQESFALQKTEDGIKRVGAEIKEAQEELQRLIDLASGTPQLGLFQQLQKNVADLQKQLQDAGSLEEAGAILPNLIEAEKQLKEFEDFIAGLRQRILGGGIEPLQPLDVITGVKDSDKAFDEAFKKVAESVKKFNETKDQDLIDKERLQQEAQEAADVFIGLSRTILAEDIARKDRQIELQRERLNEFRRIAENGNAEQLQLEEERLNGLIEARERFAQRERQLSALQVAAANARAIAEGIAATISGFKDGNVAVGIANAIALAAAVGATIVAVRNSIGTIPAFEKGTEDTGRNGRGVDGKGGFHAILHPGERVVSAKENARLRGIKNEQLPEIVDFYRANNARMKIYKSENKALNIDELIATTERTNRLLESLNIYADINEYGLQAGISRAQTKLQRKRNLAR